MFNTNAADNGSIYQRSWLLLELSLEDMQSLSLRETQDTFSFFKLFE